MPKLYDIPRTLIRARDSGVDLRGTQLLIDTLGKWKNLVVERYGGDPTGYLMANSCYRPAGQTCCNDIRGRIDLTDANGHWTGCAVDFSSRLTSWSFWGKGAPKWRRDDVRDTLVCVGLYLPWYWKHGTIDGTVLEHWHTSVELEPWTQIHAYRGTPPHWYGGLRPESNAIRTQ
ncbi:hypothetical protein KAU45_00415 [bacterium]|nr:hypothetical protein [bacterium]